MLLKASSSLSLATASSSSTSPNRLSFPAQQALSSKPSSGAASFRVTSASALPPQQSSRSSNNAVSVFEPFVEVQSQVAHIPPTSSVSFARQRFSPACEAAINDQINVEYNASYVYHNLFAYFDRDNVGLPGFAKFYKESSDEERSHAEKLMKYQNVRGGKVKLQTIVMPTVTEFDHQEKGDALHAMELTLALERLVNEKLLQLHKVPLKSPATLALPSEVAEGEDDPQLLDFIEGEFLKPQVEDIKKVSEYVSQLRRVGKGHGVYHFDLELQGEA